MARTSLMILLIVLLCVLAGCYSPDSGMSQLVPSGIRRPSAGARDAVPADVSEADVAERVAFERQAYESGLRQLIMYYKGIGNNMKLQWAQDELERFKEIPKYNYIIEANVAGPDLKATASITEADYMYYDGRQREKKARGLIVYVDENMLRLALAKYNQLIGKHPSSDKIDDAAFYAGGICSFFKDYSIALLYYQRAYQWNPETPYPARLEAAKVLDRRMHRRAESLELYQDFVERGKGTTGQLTFAKERIRELTTTGESEKD
ncbi:tol-pal system YbgF family protein [Planctomycetota bacterium]